MHDFDDDGLTPRPGQKVIITPTAAASGYNPNKQVLYTVQVCHGKFEIFCVLLAFDPLKKNRIAVTAFCKRLLATWS